MGSSPPRSRGIASDRQRLATTVVNWREHRPHCDAEL